MEATRESAAVEAEEPRVAALVAAVFGRHGAERSALAAAIRGELARARRRAGGRRADERPAEDRAIWRVALNVALERGRHSPWRRADLPRWDRADDADGSDDSGGADAPGPGDRALALQGALERLPGLDRALVLLKLEELDAARIAEVLGLDVAAAEVRARRLEGRIARELRLDGRVAALELGRAWDELAWRAGRTAGASSADHDRPPGLAGPALEFAGSASAALLCARFLLEERETLRFAFPAGVLVLAFAAWGVAAARRWFGLARLDRAAGVLDVQRRLASLSLARERSLRAALVLGPLLWTPLSIVLARELLDSDVLAERGPTFVALHVAFALAFVLLALHGARSVGERLAPSPELARLAERLSGRAIERATAEHDALERYPDPSA